MRYGVSLDHVFQPRENSFEISLWDRTFGYWNQVLLQTKFNGKSTNSTNVLGYRGFLNMALISPCKTFFTFKKQEQEYVNFFAFLWLPIYLDLLFASGHGFCDWSACRGGVKMEDGTVKANYITYVGRTVSMILRILIILVQNTLEPILHPYNFFMKPVERINELKEKGMISSKKAGLLHFIHVVKIVLFFAAFITIVGHVTIPFINGIFNHFTNYFLAASTTCAINTFSKESPYVKTNLLGKNQETSKLIPSHHKEQCSGCFHLFGKDKRKQSSAFTSRIITNRESTLSNTH